MVGSGASMFGIRPTLLSTFAGIIGGAIAAGVIALIVSTLAGLFGGKNSFARGLAATTLAFVPGYLAQALYWLPWVGALVGLGLFIYALVLLWRIIPLYLEVPDGKRTGHYILSLIATLVAMLVLSLAMRPIIGPSMPEVPVYSGSGADSRPAGLGGVVGEAMRQGELMAAAEDDSYDPPSDGKLDRNQVREFIRVMQRAEEIGAEKTARIRELAERAENDEELSLSEMSELMAGATSVMGMNTIELEIVKSAGGNWAEHEWVRNSLRTAYIQKDINDAVAHNYALYQDNEDDLKPFIAN